MSGLIFALLVILVTPDAHVAWHVAAVSLGLLLWAAGTGLRFRDIFKEYTCPCDHCRHRRG